MREIVMFISVLNDIGDGMFLIRKLTFIEKLFSLCNLFSYRGEYHSELH